MRAADRSRRNRFVAGALLPALAWVSGFEPAAAEEAAGFSRRAVIARNMHRVEFSGGVLPAPEKLPYLGEILRPLAGAVPLRTRRQRRVNDDLLVFENVPQPGTQAEPYLHANPLDSDHLVAGWQENRFMDGGAQALNVAVSFDGGKSWTESILPGLTLVSGGPWERASDPWVEFGPDNRVYFVSLLFNETSPDNAIGVSLSTDGGLTWGEPVEVFRSFFDFNDKEALTVDVYPQSRYFGRVYVAWDINVADASGQNFVAQRLVVARSRRNGSYRRPRRVRTGAANIGAIPRVGPDGTVYVVWAGRETESSRLTIYFSRSNNGGRRWSRPRIVAELLTRGVPDLRTGGILPSFAVDPASGDLYVAWQDHRWTGVDQSTLIFSRDGGATWSDPRQVSAAPPDAATFTTAVAVNGRSQVAVSYYSLENDPARAFLVDRYVRLSQDGGETFGPAIRASRRTFDVRFAALAGGFFLGDYVGLAGTERHFHLLWVSTQRFSEALGTLQPDVFAARTRR